jgi:hypothetical protein
VFFLFVFLGTLGMRKKQRNEKTHDNTSRAT